MAVAGAVDAPAVMSNPTAPTRAEPRRAQRAVVSGVARNCSRHLPRVLENLARLGGLYAKVSFVFAVSDTTDGTHRLLSDWLAAGRDGTVLDLGDLEAETPIRSARIARARNACVEEIRRSSWAAYDHLVVADLDDVLEGDLDLAACAQAARWLEAAPARAGVFANAAPRYYDIWALRHDTWCPGDCWHPIWHRRPGDSFEAAKIREVFARQIAIPPELPPIQVRSAFGGLGFYRMKFALDASYRGVDGQGRPVSEHVALNLAIGAAGGQFHILPSLLVRAPREHLYDPRAFGLRWRLAMLRRRIQETLTPPWRALSAAPGVGSS